MKPIIVIGGGGHAKVLIQAILTMESFRIRGIVDAKLKTGQSVLGIPVLGNDETLSLGEFKGTFLAIGVGHMKADSLRKRLFERYKEMSYPFPVIQHISAVVAESTHLEEGVQVMAGAIIQPEASIGINTIINTAAVVEHDCKIGNHAHISPGAVLGGGVEIGENSLVGLGARVLPGIRIGRGVLVGAGAVVTKDIPDGQTAVGIPAHLLKS